MIFLFLFFLFLSLLFWLVIPVILFNFFYNLCDTEKVLFFVLILECRTWMNLNPNTFLCISPDTEGFQFGVGLWRLSRAGSHAFYVNQ